jgi:hypothetical protein
LADCSGYLAAGARYDGPFGVRSAVDARRQRRLTDEVLDHDPARVDILGVRAGRNDHIRAHGMTVLGVTTDGAPLDPRPIALALGEAAPHQVGEFHALQELTQAGRRALARLRERLAAQAPRWPRGRPRNTPAGRRACRRAQAIPRPVSDLFERRHRFVRHHLSAAPRATRRRSARPRRARGAVRARMGEGDRRFDRRGRTDPALAKPAVVRRRVRRYRSRGKGLDRRHSPNRATALTFPGDALLPATSSAVERGHRRRRQMQKAVYRVRAHGAPVGRMALDRERDRPADGRAATVHRLHDERATR